MGCRGYFSAHPWDVRHSEAIRLLNLLAQRYIRGVLMIISGRPVAVLALRDGICHGDRLDRIYQVYRAFNAFLLSISSCGYLNRDIFVNILPL